MKKAAPFFLFLSRLLIGLSTLATLALLSVIWTKGTSFKKSCESLIELSKESQIKIVSSFKIRTSSTEDDFIPVDSKEMLELRHQWKLLNEENRRRLLGENTNGHITETPAAEQLKNLAYQASSSEDYRGFLILALVVLSAGLALLKAVLSKKFSLTYKVMPALTTGALLIYSMNHYLLFQKPFAELIAREIFMPSDFGINQWSMSFAPIALGFGLYGAVITTLFWAVSSFTKDPPEQAEAS